MVSKNPYHTSTVAASSPKRRGPWLFRSMMMGMAGFALLFGGVIYGVVMVGVPYQDPTPEMARREAFHTDVSGWAMAIGGCVLLASIVAMAVVAIFRFATRSSV